MSEDPSHKFVAYRRDKRYTNKAPSKIEFLGESYSQLKPVGAINIFLLVGGLVLWQILGKPGLLAWLLTLGTVTFGMSYRVNQKIAIGMGWPKTRARVISCLLAATSWFMFGFIVCIVLEQIVKAELRRYGVTVSFSGIKKADIDHAIAQVPESDPVQMFEIPT